MTSSPSGIDPKTLRLPPCPMPKPGEEVAWFTGSRPMQGRLVGHDVNGLAVIENGFGTPNRKPFTELRPKDPFNRQDPNWTRLPSYGAIVRPEPSKSTMLKQLLAAKIPPGPSYADLISEIWNRGFEVFVVGGTVRDVVAGKSPKDIDLVTTMPIFVLQQFLKSMYRYDPSAAKERGYIRIGGSPKSGDPFIDLKVFSDNLPGTPDAMFGCDFDKDIRHRDFACNCVYFDPINDVLIDPSGRGISDAEDQKLSLICNTPDRHQHAQIVIRTVKFVIRGFEIEAESLLQIQNEFASTLGGMNTRTRIQYLKTQILSKSDGSKSESEIISEFKQTMYLLGMNAAWDQFFAPHFREAAA